MRLASIAFALVCGCSSHASRAAKPTPTIVVLEPGAAPRQRLRYEPPIGVIEHIETSTKLRVATTFTNTVLETGQHSADFPTIVIRGRVEVTGRTPAGHALVAFAIEDLRVLDDVTDPQLRGPMEADARRVKGMRATWTLAPTGTVENFVIDAPNLTPAMRTRLSTWQESLSDTFIVFPDAEIGLGATWQVLSRPTTMGVTWDRKATYTLRELTDGQAMVDATISTRAASQALSVEPNATTTLRSGSGTITGHTQVPRRGLVGSGSSDATTESNWSIVRHRLRVTSTVQTHAFSSVKRIEQAVAEPPPQ